MGREREKKISCLFYLTLSLFFFQNLKIRSETAAALLWALVGCLGCCVPARKKRNAAVFTSSVPATPLAAAAAAAATAAAAPSPSAPPLAHAPSSEDNNRKSTATPFTEGMDLEDAEALGASTSRPGSAAAAQGGFAKVPSYKLPKFAATKAKEGGGGASSGRRSSSSRGGDAGSSSVPVAPASAFGSSGAGARGGVSNENDSPPPVSAAQPAVLLPQAPAPEALPNPQRLGFFAAVRRSMSRVASSTTSAEREVGGAAV